MVAGDDDHVPAGGSRHPAEEAVVEPLGAVARRARVEHVARHEQHVDALALDGVRQPVEKGGELLVPLAAVQGPAEMPVGGVEEVHALSLLWKVSRLNSVVES